MSDARPGRSARRREAGAGRLDEGRRLDARHPLYARAMAALGLDATPPTAPPLWARRSCFTYDAQRVLVTEVFHPAIANLAPALDSKKKTL